MIVHVVLLAPRADLTPAERASAIATLTRSAADIPDIVRYRVGRRVTHGLPGYEQKMPHDFEIALLMEFADVAALRRYLSAPAHAALGHLFSSASSAALAYDYDVVDGADAARLWGTGG